MRYLVLLIALGGAALAGHGGYKLYVLAESEASRLGAAKAEAMEEFRMVGKASYVLMLSAILGVLGGLAALKRNRLSALLLLVAIGLGAGVFFLEAQVFAAPFLLAGLLCLLITPARKPRGEDEEEEEPRKGGFFLKFLLFLVIVGAVGAFEWAVISTSHGPGRLVDPIRSLSLSDIKFGVEYPSQY